MKLNELIDRGLYYINDTRAFTNLRDGDRIVAVNEFGEQVTGTYDGTSNTVPGLPGHVQYWSHASMVDELIAGARFY